jgi:hypothetical protein
VPEAMATLEQDLENARRHFVAWLNWYRYAFPLDATAASPPPLTFQEMANRLSLSRPAVSLILAEGSVRVPDFKTLIAAARLITAGNVGTLLLTDPPPLPTRRP